MILLLYNYRFGVQGQEAENEIAGVTGAYSFFRYRISDNRIGRFLSIDPLAPDYPHNSPYAFSENRVMDGIELEGLEHKNIHYTIAEENGKPVIKITHEKKLKFVSKWGVNYILEDGNGNEIRRDFCPTDAPRFHYGGRDAPVYMFGAKVIPGHYEMEGNSDGANTGVTTKKDVMVGGTVIAAIVSGGLALEGAALLGVTIGNVIEGSVSYGVSGSVDVFDLALNYIPGSGKVYKYIAKPIIESTFDINYSIENGWDVKYVGSNKDYDEVLIDMMTNYLNIGVNKLSSKSFDKTYQQMTGEQLLKTITTSANATVKKQTEEGK